MDARLTDAVRAAAIANGFPAAIAALLSAGETAGLTDDAPPRGLLEISYEGTRKGRERRIVVAQASTPTVDDVVGVVRDQYQFGRLFLAARSSLPKALRDEPLPDWLEGMSNDIGSGLARATQLSRAAMANAG